MNTTMILVQIVVAMAGGIGAGLLTRYVFNRIPAKWLCDYDEEPSREMWGARIKKRPWDIVFILVFSAAALKLIDNGFLFFVPGLVAVWILMQIGIADWKYMIIPDQFVIALAVTALGFIPFHESFQTQLLGALAGGGSLLLIGILGRLLYRKEALGFGDVKLMSSLGLLCGFRGIAIVFILAIFSSALVFAVGLISGKVKKDDQKPLGPFIAVAAALYVLFYKEVFIWFPL